MNLKKNLSAEETVKALAKRYKAENIADEKMRRKIVGVRAEMEQRLFSRQQQWLIQGQQFCCSRHGKEVHDGP